MTRTLRRLLAALNLAHPGYRPPLARIDLEEGRARLDAAVKAADGRLPGLEERITTAVRDALAQLQRTRTVAVEPVTTGERVAEGIASAVLAEVHRATEQPSAGLRQQYADALRTTPSTGNTHKPGEEKWDHHPKPGEPGHNYTYTCALCRNDVDALADAVMAVRDAELERARARLDNLREISRQQNDRLHGELEQLRARVQAVADGDMEMPDYVERDKLRTALDGTEQPAETHHPVGAMAATEAGEPPECSCGNTVWPHDETGQHVPITTTDTGTSAGPCQEGIAR